MDRNSRRINMKVADPAAYSDIAEIDTSSPFVALGKPFRGLIIVPTTSAATLVFDLTTVAGVSRTGLTFVIPANQTFILPIAGNNIVVSTATNITKVYAVI
jgi:hypothetical protein